MKTICLLPLFCLVAASIPAFGQLPRTHSLSFDAESTAAGGGTKSGEKTGSVATQASQTNAGLAHHLATTQTQTASASEAVHISVRNFSAQPDTAHVEWYFVAQPVKPEPGKPASEQQFVFDKGAKDVSLAANGTQTFDVESKEITATVARRDQARVGRAGKVNVNRNSLGAQQTGDKLDGWMVRVVADGKTVAAKGSSSSLEDIAKDDAKLHALDSEPSN